MLKYLAVCKMTVKHAWGKKRTCHNCNARFYDLRQVQIVCPACGAVHDPDRQPKPRRHGLSARALLSETAIGGGVTREVVDNQPQPPEIEEIDGDSIHSAGDGEMPSDSNTLIEDTSDLGEDDDDIGEVIEHMDDDSDEKH